VTNIHPLEPLTAEEIIASCSAVRDHAVAQGSKPEDLRYPIVTLAEPAKDQLDTQPARQAEVNVLDRASGDVHEAIVDLATASVKRWHHVPGVRPVMLFEESFNAIGVVQANPEWQAAMRLRGITDFDKIQIDPWPAGWFDWPEEEGRRLARCVTYIREDPGDNGYASPVEGLVVVVDLATSEVLRVIDEGPVTVPKGPGRYGAEDVGPLRTDLKPIEVVQPEGPSFELDGHALRWQKWRLRFSLHPIEGLVLHQVGYEDGGRVRPILHRASIVEMVVPYGSTQAAHWWKNAFDVGEWGLGRMTQSLALGCDCLGEIRYVDGVLPDENGGARVIANAICIHEEDFGILWKHVDLWTGANEVRRSRRLVVSFIATVGNYEYGFYWYFYLDGTIQLEVKLTGILQTGAIEPGARPRNGEMLAPGLWGPNHQHLFCARLDMEVDGSDNRVYELDTVGVPMGPDNPGGNAIETVATLLETEASARRDADASRARRWKVANESVRNAVGEPVAYALLPAPAVRMLADPNASVAKRAAFARHNLWVTPYDPAQRRPAGEYPNQHRGGDGLPAWTDGRSIVDRDIVLWHSFGVTHVPRPEDFPVMPVEYVGFMLKPVGFFESNPALDVPPSAHCQA